MVDATKFFELIFVATVNPIACGEAIYYTLSARGKQVWILIFGLAMIPKVFSELSEITLQDQYAYNLFRVSKLCHRSCLLPGPKRFLECGRFAGI